MNKRRRHEPGSKTTPLSKFTQPLEIYTETKRRYLYPLQKKLRRFKYLLSSVVSLGMGFLLVFTFINYKDHPEDLLKYLPSPKTLEAWGLKDIQKIKEKTDAVFSRLNNDVQSTFMRHNMEVMRIMLEAYKVEGRTYPDTIADLHSAATSKNFWQPLRNPYTGSFSSYEGTVTDYADYIDDWDHINYKGHLIYRAMGKDALSYRIYACDDKGELIQSFGEDYYISPSK